MRQMTIDVDVPSDIDESDAKRIINNALSEEFQLRTGVSAVNIAQDALNRASKADRNPHQIEVEIPEGNEAPICV